MCLLVQKCDRVRDLYGKSSITWHSTRPENGLKHSSPAANQMLSCVLAEHHRIIELVIVRVGKLGLQRTLR